MRFYQAFSLSLSLLSFSRSFLYFFLLRSNEFHTILRLQCTKYNKRTETNQKREKNTDYVKHWMASMHVFLSFSEHFYAKTCSL